MHRTIKMGVSLKMGVSKWVFQKGSILGPVLFSCYLVLLEVLFERLDVNYQFYAHDIVIYFVYYASINQGALNLILTTLQEWFSDAKLLLKSNRDEYMFIGRKNSLNNDNELPADANFSYNVTLLRFNLD